MMKIFRKKLFWVIIIVIVIVALFMWQRNGKNDGQAETITVMRGTIVQTVDVTGTVDASTIAALSFETSGTVVNVSVAVGDTVKKGQILIEKDRSVLNAQYRQAKVDVAIAQEDLLLSRRHWEDLKPEERETKKLAVKKAVHAAEAIAQNISKTILPAPFDGTVTKVDVEPFETVGALATVVTVVEQESTLKLSALVPESDIDEIAVGQKASVTFDAFDTDEIFAAEIVKIEPQATVVQDVVFYEMTLKIIDFDQPRERQSRNGLPVSLRETLRAGMSADIDVHVAQKDDVLMVERRVIKEDARGLFVEILLPSGETEERIITTGLENDEGDIEVTNGLSEGEKIVTSSQ